MKKAPHVFAVPVLIALIWSSTAAAQPRRMAFSGCVRPGVTQGCLIVHSGEAQFNVSTARPRPRLNRWIEGSGMTGPGVTLCNQGVQLTAVTWRYVRQQCPPAPPAAPPPRP